ncbi:MAG: DUF5362 family protein [Bacteroidales bacterium]
MENNLQNETELTISKEIGYFLLETSRWGKFLAIVGYIGKGLLILLALFMMFGLSHFSPFSAMPYPMGIFGFVYIIMAIIYYFPATYLYKFSVQMKQGLLSNDQMTVNSGFQNLKSIFKFMGIFTIVILSIYGLFLLILVPVMMFMR